MAISITMKIGNVTLRHVRLSDAKLFFDAEQDEEARSNFAGGRSTPRNIKGVENELKENIKQYGSKKPTSEKFAIEYKGKLAGYIDLNEMNAPLFEHKANLCYCLHKDFRGEGIMTTALKAITKYTFKKYKLKRLEGWCRTFNKGSARALEKAGFTLEAVLHKNKYKNGKYLDDMIWAIVR